MSGVRWKGHDVRGGLMFEPGQPVEAVEIVARRAASHIAGVVTGVTRAGEDDDEGTVIVFRTESLRRAWHRHRRIGAPFATGGSLMDRCPPVTTRSSRSVPSTRRMFGKPDVAELLRARGTNVTLGENETKTVNLTLITDY